jgi:hypothetical protein
MRRTVLLGPEVAIQREESLVLSLFCARRDEAQIQGFRSFTALSLSLKSFVSS